MIDVVIVTVKREEFEAVLDHFPKPYTPKTPSRRDEYSYRQVTSRDGFVRSVAITRCAGQGNADAQTVVTNAVEELHPKLVLLVGIAGAPPTSDAFLGDVVVGTHVHNFTLSAETARGTELSTSGGAPPEWLVRIVSNLDFRYPPLNSWSAELGGRPLIGTDGLDLTCSDEEWGETIAQTVRKNSARVLPRVVEGSIASSDELLKHQDPMRLRLAVDRKIFAVEMESVGVAKACANVAMGEAPIAYLPIRGISDIVGLRRDPAWEGYACRVAGAFSASLVAALPQRIFGEPTSDVVDVASLIESLTSADGVALSWEVIEGGLGLTRAQFLQDVASDLESGRLVASAEGVGGIRQRALTGGEAGLPALFDALLAFIRKHGSNEQGLKHVRPAARVALGLVPSQGHLAARTFDVLDHPMKALGDKNLVKEVAQACIEGANSLSLDRSAAECIARARICGLSWALQRQGELELAQHEANQSFELGRKLGLQRNDAYCLKCIGRLLRMRAECAVNKEDRARLLEQSEEKLRDAIAAFSALSGIGNDHEEVGDCYSLLGRTLLVMGRFADARIEIGEADLRLRDESSKDYLDLQILKGDVEAAIGRPPGEYYSRVISQQKADIGREKSEILARAYFQRGSSQVTSHKARAISDFEAASAIWKELGEVRPAATARWEAIRLRESIPTKTVQAAEKHPPEVRVAAFDLIEQAGKKKKNVLAQRKGHDAVAWGQALKKAAESLALKNYR